LAMVDKLLQISYLVNMFFKKNYKKILIK